MELAGKTAFITGGGGGIGGAMAKAFAENGAKVAVADVNLSRAQAVADVVNSITKACAIRLDVTKADEWGPAKKAVEDALGPVDILCANAGVSYTAPLDEITDEAFRWVHNVNIMGALRAIRTFLPEMKRRRQGGHVVLTCSTTAFRPYTEQGAYATSKAALVNMALTLDMEVKASGIGVSALCPGLVNTNLRNNAEDARPVPLRSSALTSEEGSPLKAGMAPAFVANSVIDAIRNDRFYVFTHSDYRDAIAAEQQLVLAALAASADPSHKEPTGLVARIRDQTGVPQDI